MSSETIQLRPLTHNSRSLGETWDMLASWDGALRRDDDVV
jgi:hypothetical protein